MIHRFWIKINDFSAINTLPLILSFSILPPGAPRCPQNPAQVPISINSRERKRRVRLSDSTLPPAQPFSRPDSANTSVPDAARRSSSLCFRNNIHDIKHFFKSSTFEKLCSHSIRIMDITIKSDQTACKCCQSTEFCVPPTLKLDM